LYFWFGKMINLSVNINKIATLRNARGGNNPNLIKMAEDIQSYGAQGITVHPRPDERHIKYDDVRNLKSVVKKEFNRDTRSLYHDIYSSPGLKKSYVVNDVLEDFKSKVGQHIEILDLEQFGKSLFIDGEIQVAASDEHLYSSTFVGAGLNLNKDNERVAIIGGGDGGVARECISKKFNFVDWYELDPEVVDVCSKHLGDIGKKATEKNSVKCVWGDAFESIKSVGDDTYDHIFVDLNDDQFCIDLAAKNMDSLVRILKPKGVITAQVGSQDKKPQQVENWLNVFNQNFGNAKLSRVYIPSFDCSWNFSSSINH